MKKTKLLFFGLLLASLLIPYIAVVHAKKTPSYVGISEGQTIVWNTEFDKGPLQDFWEDTGATEEDAEEVVNIQFRGFHWDEAYEAWMIQIHKIGDEGDEWEVEEDKSFNADVLRVKYQYSLYKTKNRANPDWLCRERWDSARLWDNDEEFFEALQFSLWFGISTREDWNFPELIIPKNLDYGEIVKLVEEVIEGRNWEDYADVGTVKIQHYNTQKAVGIKTEFNYGQIYPEYKNEIDDFESEARYNDDGILYYYESSYDGDTIAKFEKEYIFGQNTEFYFENWWWMSLVAGAVAVVIIIVVVIIIKKKKS